MINLSLTPEERKLEYIEEKKLIEATPKSSTIDPSTAAFIFNKGDKFKKYQPHRYDKATEKYGLVICDVKKVSCHLPHLIMLSHNLFNFP